MKVRKMASAGLLLLCATSANALEVEHKGQFRLRHENYDIYEGRSDKSDFTAMRLRAGLNFKIDDKRRIFIAPQAVKSFGEVIAEPQTDGTIKSRQSSGDKFDGSLQFHEAFAEVPFGDLKLKMGRQELSYGDKIVLGNRNWTPNGQTFDAVKASADLWGGQIDLVYSKISNEDSSTVTDDASLYFLYYKVMKTDKTEFDAYVISNNKASDGANNDSLSSGFRWVQKFGNFSFNTENIYQDLPEQSKSAYNLNLVLDYKIGKLKTFASYMVATENYDQLYTNRHKYNGLIDIVGRKNLDTVSLGGKYNLSDKWSLKAEAFQFTKHSDEDLAYNQATSKTLTGDIDESDLGTEFDLILNYKPGKNEIVSIAYSTFQHGDYFEEQDTSHFGYLQYLLKF